MELKARIQVGTLRSWIGAISSIVNESLFEVKDNEIRVTQMDPSQVSLVTLQMRGENFEEFNLEGSSEGIMLPVGEMERILKRADSSDEVQVSLNEKRAEILLNGKARRRFTLRCFSESPPNGQRIPQIDYTARANVHKKSLLESLKDARSVGGDYCRLSIDNQMTLFSNGDSGTLKVEEMSENSEGTASASFSIEFLEKFLKAAPDTDVEIQLKDDSPLKMSYEIQGILITYFLAPRIEE